MAQPEEDNFIQTFIKALSNDTVIQKLQNAVCGQLQREVQGLKDVIKSKDAKISELEIRITVLESKQDEADQYSRRNSLRISGIEEGNSDDVEQKVLDLFNNTLSITPPVEAGSIDRVHRVGKKQDDTPRQILVKFATYRTRDKVIRSRRKLRPVPSAATQGRVQQKIFIYEDLTKSRSNLLWNARKVKREKKIEDCWSWDGTILIKTNVGRIIPIHSMADLNDAAV